MISLQLFQLISLLISISGFPDVYHVTSGEADDCPVYHCFPLEDYVADTKLYFSDGSIFIFLPGNHTLQTKLVLTTVSNILFRGEGQEPSTATVIDLVNAITLENTNDIRFTGLTFLLHSYEQNYDSAVYVDHSGKRSIISVIDMIFLGNGIVMPYIRTFHCSDSNITIRNSQFFGNTGENGGAIYVESKTVLMLFGAIFHQNKAELSGGAIYVKSQSTLVLVDNTFLENKATETGGAISIDEFELLTSASCLIVNSSFTSNSVNTGNGGAIHCSRCNLTLQGQNMFRDNYIVGKLESYSVGGAIYIIAGFLNIRNNILFSSNKAYQGGAVYIIASTVQAQVENMTFDNNSDGAMSIFYSRSVTFHGNVFFSNNTAYLQSALYSVLSSISFAYGMTAFINNKGNLGGAMLVLEESRIEFSSSPAIFLGNSASSGGAIYTANGYFTFHYRVRFFNNKAAVDGGAIYASETRIAVQPAASIKLLNNSAKNGGAIYLRSSTSLHFMTRSKYIMDNNYASDYGGAVYYEDSANPPLCSINNLDVTEFNEDIIPYCFLVYDEYPSHFINNETTNIAGKDGSNLYGGQLDKCRLRVTTTILFPVYDLLIDKAVLQNNTRLVSSAPYKLCFCENNNYDCTGERSRVVHRGQRTNVVLIALAQGDLVVSTFVRALTSNTAKLDLQQNFQHLPQQCSIFTYTIYSTRDEEELVLYSDGPCHTTGLARALVRMTVLPCPDTFVQYEAQCICEKRLRDFANCIIIDEPFITKNNGSMIWLNGTYHNNGSYEGLILFQNCPRPYCLEETVNITLKNPDIQCGLNRSGILCGACAKGFSVMLGSSRCEKCSNSYLALLVVFVVAGIVLTAFLTVLRLTVATGMINSIILYANIVQVNRSIFFPTNSVNIFSIFIAWMNLDLGLETCFFDGMNEYFQTWLQFAFPFYVWVLISMIILISRHSIWLSKLIGSNPIAVLATLLLMSYNKILKIIVEVYSSVDLDYPAGKKVTVWLKDANVPYLQSKHLALTLVTSMILTLLFIPYTLLLLLGYKVYRFSGRKYLCWFQKLKPILDSYYAPYNIKTRYWTGFMLLIRCILYIIFSYSSLQGEKKSLLAIIVTFTGVTIIAWLSVTIYKIFVVNLIEASVYLNLIILAATTLAIDSSPGLTYSMVGIVLVTTICIIAYHFHISYIVKSAIWLKFTAKLINFVQKRKDQQAEDVATNSRALLEDQSKFVTKTHFEFRETVLGD